MQDIIHNHFCNQFLCNQDKLISLIETSVEEPVDKLVVISFFLEEQDKVLECIFMSNGQLKKANIKIKEAKQIEEE